MMHCPKLCARVLRRFTLTGIPGQYSSSARVEYNEMKNQGGKPPSFRQLRLASSDNQARMTAHFGSFDLGTQRMLNRLC